MTQPSPPNMLPSRPSPETSQSILNDSTSSPFSIISLKTAIDG